MCDPLSLIMGGLSAASSVMGAVTQQNAVKKQENANNQWMQYQRQQRLLENQRQEEMRQKANVAREGTVQDMTAAEQGKAQDTEQARLEEALGANDPSQKAANAAGGNQADTNAALLAGESQGGQFFAKDMASRVSKATADARSRLKALAGVQSFGGSQGGLQTRNALELQQGEEGINLQNNFRQGSLSAFGAAQAVDPIQYATVSNPWGGIANTLAGVAGQRGGFTLGKA